MSIHVRLFAMLRERAGWRQRDFELAEGSTVERAWQVLAAEFPALASYRSVVRFARNGSYVPPEQLLADGDDLAIIPPVAGGAADDAGRLHRFELTGAPIADGLLAELRRTVPTAKDGALVLFVGQTRETPGHPSPAEEDETRRHAGEPVQALEYEAYDEMVIAVLRQIGAEVDERFGVRRLAMIHRVGHVPLSQPSVVIAAAAPHRAAAFDACRYAIDELKSRAPIWKRERYADGSVWIGGSAADEAADD